MSRTCLRHWCDNNPDFAEQLREARERYEEETCTLAPPVIHQHLQDVLDRRKVKVRTRHWANTKGEWTEREEETQPIPALVRLATRRLGWEKRDEDTGAESPSQIVRRIAAARMLEQ